MGVSQPQAKERAKAAKSQVLWHYPLLQVTFAGRLAASKNALIYSRNVCGKLHGYLTQQSLALGVPKSDPDSPAMVIREPSK